MVTIKCVLMSKLITDMFILRTSESLVDLLPLEIRTERPVRGTFVSGVRCQKSRQSRLATNSLTFCRHASLLIRKNNSKDRQYNGQKTKGQATIYKILHRKLAWRALTEACTITDSYNNLIFCRYASLQ